MATVFVVVVARLTDRFDFQQARVLLFTLNGRACGRVCDAVKVCGVKSTSVTCGGLFREVFSALLFFLVQW